MSEIKSQEYNSLSLNNSVVYEKEMIMDDDYLTGSNLDLPSIIDSTYNQRFSSNNPNLSSSQSIYSSNNSNESFTSSYPTYIDNGALNSCEKKNVSQNTHSLTESTTVDNKERIFNNVKEDLDNFDEIDESTIDGFGNMSEKLTKNLAIKYNTLSENRQNELEILTKMEYFLLKYKWNAKVLEVENTTYSVNTILECGNSCESKLNLTNLVVRLKFRIDKILPLSNQLTNEFVNEYLAKLIHLNISKHKCSPMSNELSLILIRNFFKQFQINENDKNISEMSSCDSSINMNLYNLLKQKIDIHLIEAHSLISYNQLSNIPLNYSALSPVSCSKLQYNTKLTELGSSLNNQIINTLNRRNSNNLNNVKNTSSNENIQQENLNLENTNSLIKQRLNNDRNHYFFDDEFFIEDELLSPKKNNYENSKIDDEYIYSLPSDLLSKQVSPVNDDKNTLNISIVETPFKSLSDIDLLENSTSSTLTENHLILKAINRRKLQLACPICSSCVVNMSDHLVKKHSIKDRNERKYLMDLVRRTYLSIGVSKNKLSNSYSPTVATSSQLSPQMMNSNDPGVTVSMSDVCDTAILAASFNFLQQQKLQLQITTDQTNQQLRNVLVQNQEILPSHTQGMNSNENTEQNFEITDHANEFTAIGKNSKTDSILSSGSNTAISQFHTNENNKNQSSTYIITSPNQINNNNNRKFIKCPICLDDNKYFVNISDHLIKIHHLITGEMRKPILKQIKENSSLSINKTQFDLVFSSNLNKKIKLDSQWSAQQNSGQLVSQKFTDKNQSNDQNVATIPNILQVFQEIPQFNQKHLLKIGQQIQREMMKDRSQSTRSDETDPVMDETLIDSVSKSWTNISSCNQNTNELGEAENVKKLASSDNNKKLKNETVKQRINSFESGDDKEFNKDRSMSPLNENSNKNLMITNWNNNSLGTNLLITDEDIADYSDLISLNYDPIFTNINQCTENTNPNSGPNQYDNIEFDFETDELYNTETDANCSNYNNSNSLIYDENAISESLDEKKRKIANNQDFQNLPKLIKRLRNSFDSINFADSNDVITSINTPLLYTSFENKEEYYTVAFNPTLLVSSEEYNDRNQKSAANKNELTDLNEALYSPDLEFQPQKITERNQTDSLYCSNNNLDSDSSSALGSPLSNFSSFSKELRSDQISKTFQDSITDDAWQKLNNIELNLNNSVKEFQLFTESIMGQLKTFSDQVKSGLDQVASLKKIITEFRDGKQITDKNS